jgi:hypothetical protein
MSTVQAHIAEWARQFSLEKDLARSAMINARKSFLEAAVLPLFPQSLVDRASATLHYPDLADVIGRVNTGVQNSLYLGEVEFGGGSDEGESSEGSGLSDHDLGESLVEIIPAETLECLKRVDFIPLTVLDGILRSPEAMRTLSARDFEKFIATLIDQLGFENVELTPSSGDQGRDIIASKRMHGIPIIFAFECKLYKPGNPVGPDILRALLGTVRHARTAANKGVLVTTSTFSPGARTFLLSEPAIDGKDFDGIVDWLGDYSVQSRSRRGHT